MLRIRNPGTFSPEINISLFQVKELVEYLSSEDTWSDSYDSSDYTDATSTASDLDIFGDDLGGHKGRQNDEEVPEIDVVIQAFSPFCDLYFNNGNNHILFKIYMRRVRFLSSMETPNLSY